MKIKFCGAASGVTGSCHLLTVGEHKILLDCGQFQGGKAIEAMNYEDFPFDPKEIECVILSHAHIDHCGRIPLLVKRGFQGKVYCSDATAQLVDIMLKDSGYIHEKEAEWKNKKAQRAGKDQIKPLYTYNDAVEALKYITPVLYDQLIEINEDIRIVFNDAGHILGSAITEIWATENGKTSKIVFSGDIGVMGRPILRDPTIIKKADVLIMETTYGNRVHPEGTDSIEDLVDIVLKTAKRGGSVVIPSFAVGRTQELIYQFNKFYEERPEFRRELDKLKVYIDSPMATNATEVFKANAQVFDEEARDYLMRGDDPLDFPGLKFTRTTQESKALNEDASPKIIISASGMCEAGRIRHHLKHNLWDARCSIVFVGYQAEGTLGRYITNGVKDVTLFGEQVHVNAQIHNLEGFSGHADKNGLLAWAGGFQKQPKQVFLVHGEQQSKLDFAEELKKVTGMEATVITDISEYELETGVKLSEEQKIHDALDKEAMQAMRKKISDLHFDMESLLYRTSLAVNHAENAAKLAEINNKLLELEKSTISLGSALSEESMSEDEKMSELKSSTSDEAVRAFESSTDAEAVHEKGAGEENAKLSKEAYPTCPYCGSYMNQERNKKLKCGFCGCTAEYDADGDMKILQGGI